MRNIHLFATLLFFLLGCTTLKVPEPPKKERLSCRSMEPQNIFNGLRIKATQDIIQSHIDQKKSIKLNPNSTEELSVLEQIRRKVSFPLLSSQLDPSVVTRVLKNELEAFKKILESDSTKNPNTQKTLDYLNSQILLTIDLPESWTCNPVDDENITIQMI